ncbi:MAG TPA: hypothetical protein VFW64_22590 [Pseudonocardiaceae bacterium]|nr:hypothetical protein [Pseudonocardiaceae bacterium]
MAYAELPLVATIHPFAVLRGPKDRQAECSNDLMADLQLAGRTISGLSGVG